MKLRTFPIQCISQTCLRQCSGGRTVFPHITSICNVQGMYFELSIVDAYTLLKCTYLITNSNIPAREWFVFSLFDKKICVIVFLSLGILWCLSIHGFQTKVDPDQ